MPTHPGQAVRSQLIGRPIFYSNLLFVKKYIALLALAAASTLFFYYYYGDHHYQWAMVIASINIWAFVIVVFAALDLIFYYFRKNN